MDAGREGGSGSIRGRCEQDGTPRRPQAHISPREALQRPVTPGNRPREELPGLRQSRRGLCPAAPGQPRAAWRFCAGHSPALRDHPASSSPGERGCGSGQRPPLPGPSGQREVQRPGLWEPRPRCANDLSPAPGRTLGTREAAATAWQRSLSRRPRAKPDQFQGTQSTYWKLITLNSSKGYRDRK